MNVNKYKNLKTTKEKRLYCINLDFDKKYFKLLSYEKLSLFSVNVCFENITGHQINEKRKSRNINFNEEKNY